MRPIKIKGKRLRGYAVEDCIGDGNCLIHALCKIYYGVYRRSYLNPDKYVYKRHMKRHENKEKFTMESFRRSFAKHIRENLGRKVRNLEFQKHIRENLPGLFESVYDGYPANLDRGSKEYPPSKNEEDRRKLDQQVFEFLSSELLGKRQLLHIFADICSEYMKFKHRINVKLLFIHNNVPIEDYEILEDVKYAMIYHTNGHYDVVRSSAIRENPYIFTLKYDSDLLSLTKST